MHVHPQPARIALDLSCLLERPWTGVAHYTFELLHALLARGEFEMHLFAGAARPDASAFDSLRAAAASVRVARFPTRLRSFLWTRGTWPPIERFTGPVDIAHGAFHLLPATRNAKRVVTIFDLSAFLHPDTRPAASAALHRHLIAHAVPRADLVLTLSERVRQELLERFRIPPPRVAVVPGGVRLNDFDIPEEAVASTRARLGIPPDYFLHLGTLDPRKNLPRLIEAHARVARHADCPPLVLAGSPGWNDAPVRAAIARHGSKVLLTGYIPRSDALALLRGARACIYPSQYEGFGLPVLEAMAAGTPVLTSAETAMAEVAGDTAILADATDTDALADAIATLLDAPELALRRAQEAQARARDYSWESAAQSLAQLYRQL
jgi:alpha-1,3-rhamnosyl/mannosyltransferase